jgi:hypothetical protein
MAKEICGRPMRSKYNIMLIMIGLFILFGDSAICLQISPAKIDRSVLAGENIEQEIILTNTDPIALDFEIGIFGMGQSLDSGLFEIKADEEIYPFSATEYLKIYPTTIHLEPAQEKRVYLEIAVPPDMPDGSKYALIGIHQVADSSKEMQTLVYMGIPVILYKNTPNFIKIGQITNLELSWPNVSITFKNIGNTGFKIQCEALLKSDKGDTIESINYSSEDIKLKNSIIPLSEIQFEISLESKDRLEAGDYIASIFIKLDDGTIIDSKDVLLSIPV